MLKRCVFAIRLLQGSDLWVTIAFLSLQVYLTKVWGLSITHAAAILNVWAGMCFILPCFFLYAADQFLGHFVMLILSSIAYCSGVALIAMSTPPALARFTDTCTQNRSDCVGHTQKVLFYTGLAFLAVGKSGHNVSLIPFLEKQNEGIGTGRLTRFALLWIALSAFATLVAVAIPTISIPWPIQYGIAAACSATGMLIFVSFSYFYDKTKTHRGSPIVIVVRVLVACATKKWRPLPTDADQRYKLNGNESFTSTRFLRCLEKAAIYNHRDDVNDRWKVCSVAEVEDAKTVIRVIPMWTTFIVCGILISMETTYFVEQENNMNRQIGKWNAAVQVPLVFTKMLRSFVRNIARKVIIIRRNQYGELVNRNSKRPAIGIGLAMIFSLLCCIIAARVETRRLNVIRHHGLVENTGADIPMSYYWLLFQFFLIAGVDLFLEHGVGAFCAYRAPESMRDYLEHFREGMLGVGYMLSVFSVYVVGQISEMGGKPNWFQHTLNKSRLDKYYWVLAVLCSINFVVYILVACMYRYRVTYAKEDAEAANEGEKTAEGADEDTKAANEGEKTAEGADEEAEAAKEGEKTAEGYEGQSGKEITVVS